MKLNWEFPCCVACVKGIERLSGAIGWCCRLQEWCLRDFKASVILEVNFLGGETRVVPASQQGKHACPTRNSAASS